jgi:hypothetical protein
MKRKRIINNERHVRTVYYRGKEVVKEIASRWPLNAVKNCVGYMRKNTYEATVAEVYSTTHGRLYAVLKRDVDGNMRILYEYKPTKQELES